jgi:Bacterial type II/III secretion system short domain
MNTLRCLPVCVCAALVSAGWLLTAAPALAQRDNGATKTHVIRLKNARAAEAIKVLRDLYRDKAVVSLSADDRTNSLIVSASPDVVPEIARLIQVLDDAAAQVPDESHDFLVVRLRGIEPDKKLVEALQLLLPNAKAGRFIVDPGRKLLLVQGSPALHKAVQALLTRIEMESMPSSAADNGLQVRLLWLVGGKLAKADGVPVGAFADLADDLKKLGLDPFRFGAHALVHATPAAPFTVTGSAAIEGASLVKLTGKLAAPQDGMVGLELTVAVMQAAEGSSVRLCDLQTEVRVPLGKMVVVGAAPVRGEPSVFIVQVIDPGAAKVRAKKAAQ